MRRDLGRRPRRRLYAAGAQVLLNAVLEFDRRLG